MKKIRIPAWLNTLIAIVGAFMALIIFITILGSIGAGISWTILKIPYAAQAHNNSIFFEYADIKEGEKRIYNVVAKKFDYIAIQNEKDLKEVKIIEEFGSRKTKSVVISRQQGLIRIEKK